MRLASGPTLLLALALPLALGPAAFPSSGAADPRQAEAPVLEAAELGELLRAARDPRATPARRLEAMEALLAAGPQGSAPLASQLEREATRVRREYERSLPRFLRAYERAVQKASAGLKGRAVEAEVAERRAAILAGVRDPQLSSERIREVSDPALARLEELLSLDANAIFDLEPERFDELSGLLDSLLEQRTLHELWTRARQRLLDAGHTSRARSLVEPHDPTGEEEALHQELEFAALLATPMAASDADTLRANRARGRDASLGVDPEELLGIEHLNRIRILCGLSALALDPRLCDASRDHSVDMVKLNFFSHTSPLKGKESFGQRAASFGTSARAENISAGQATGAAAIRSWWHSPGHHKNQLGNHSRVGLGRCEQVWTQMFG